MNLRKIKILFLVVFCSFLQELVAGDFGKNMRQCVVLPITDNVKGTYSYNIFTMLESRLSKHTWCHFKSNSEILNILKSYERNLNKFLDDKKLLVTIANKLQVGSLLRIHLEVKNTITNVSFKVYGSNGEDIYFEEKLSFNKNDTNTILLSIDNWLKEYSTKIPYDGVVTGILGREILINLGHQRLKKGHEVRVVRAANIKKHPILNKIVDWDINLLGMAKVKKVNKFESLALVIKQMDQTKIMVGDWIRIGLVHREKMKADTYFDEEMKKRREDSKLGLLSLGLNLGRGSQENVFSSGDKSINGYIFGLTGKAELWIMRNLWSSIDLTQNIGSFEKDDGTLDKQEFSYSHTGFKFKFGYKYLPLGFFYGPQIDAYLGFRRDIYSIERSNADGFSDFTLSGPLFGIGGDMPLKNFIRLNAYLDLYFANSFDEDVTLLGGADSVKGYELGLGAILLRNNKFNYFFKVVLNGQKVAFKANSLSVSEFKNKESYLQAGMTYQY